MSEQKKIRISPNGYDIKDVNNVLNEYHKRFELLKKGIEKRNAEIKRLNSMCNSMFVEIKSLRQTNEKFAQDNIDIINKAKQEAENIMLTAESNADLIIKESLNNASYILAELNKITEVNQKAKLQMQIQISEILDRIDRLDDIDLDLPDLSWVEKK